MATPWLKELGRKIRMKRKRGLGLLSDIHVKSVNLVKNPAIGRRVTLFKDAAGDRVWFRRGAEIEKHIHEPPHGGGELSHLTAEQCVHIQVPDTDVGAFFAHGGK